MKKLVKVIFILIALVIISACNYSDVSKIANTVKDIVATSTPYPTPIPVSFAEVNPDSSCLFAFSSAGKLHLYDMQNHKDIQIPGMEYVSSLIAWSPDGTRFAVSALNQYNGDIQIFINDLVKNTSTMVSVPDTNCLDPKWSPDGNKILFGCSPNYGSESEPSINVVNADGSTVMPIQHNVCGGTSVSYPYNMEWSPEGNSILAQVNCNNTDSIFIFSADGTKPVKITSEGVFGSSQPMWTADGLRIVYSCQMDVGQDVCVADLNSPENTVTNLTRDLDLNLTYYPQSSPDGLKIAFTSDKNFPRNVYYMSIDGTGLVQITGDAQYFSSPVWMPDSQKILYINSNKSIQMYDLVNGETEQLASGDNIFDITVSPVCEYY